MVDSQDELPRLRRPREEGTPSSRSCTSPPRWGPTTSRSASATAASATATSTSSTATGAWGSYPMVPGHEIVGTVAAPGARGAPPRERASGSASAGSAGPASPATPAAAATRTCAPANAATCVDNHGGFADRVRLDGRFAFPIPEALASENAAPLLCGGITVYSPLRRWVKPSMRVGRRRDRRPRPPGPPVRPRHGLRGDRDLLDPGQGGRGPRASAPTTSSPPGSRRPSARRRRRLDFILSTVFVDPGLGRASSGALRPNGVLCLVGAPERAAEPPALGRSWGARRPSPRASSAAGPRSGRCSRSRPGTVSRRRRSSGRWPRPTRPSARCGRAGPATGSSSPADARPARKRGSTWPIRRLRSLSCPFRRAPTNAVSQSPPTRRHALLARGGSRGRLNGFPRRPRPWRRTGLPPAPRGAASSAARSPPEWPSPRGPEPRPQFPRLEVPR